MLQSQLEQSTFGIVNDAKLLSMKYDPDDSNGSSSCMEQDHHAPALDEYQEMSYSKKTRRHARIQGNDIIVALSEYGKLVFMTIIQDAMTRRFETLAEVYLDSPGLEYTKKGKKLAIDPYGRAIAIASFQDHFDILILDKTTSRIHFDPIIGRGSEFEEGIIWQMEFLHTESDAMDKILLVLTVYKLVLYSIDASDMKNVTIEKISRLPLEKNTPLPLLLIPLTFQTEAFLLVTEQNVSYLKADDLACGNVLYPTSQIPRKPKSIECPLFTAYAGMLNSYERYIYLGSSEGHLYRLGVDVWGERREVQIEWQPLDSTNPISQAMCVLGRMDVEEPRGFRGTDVLLCAGESADNQVLAMCTSTLPFRRDVVQTMANRAPLTDYQVADSFIGDQDAIITCSGQDLHGALSVVTHGIEASHITQSSKYEWKGVSRVWQVKASVSLHEQVSCLVVSSLLDTRLLCAKEGHIKDMTSLSNIDFSTETVYATSIAVNDYHLLLQVHVAGFSVIDIGSKEVLLDSSPLIGSDDRIEMATCWQEGDAIYVAFCMIRNSSFSLELVRIDTHSTSSFSLSDKQIASEPLPYCPSCLACFSIGSKASLVVGTFQPSVLIYTVENESLEQIQQVDLSLQRPGSFTVPFSAVVLSSWLVLGLRQGSVLCLAINFDQESIHVESSSSSPQHASQIFDVGQSAVDLVPCEDGIYALSGLLWKITCTVDDAVRLDRVLVPKLGFINAFCLFDCGLSTAYSERIALMADDKLHMFDLSPDTQLTTHKIELKDTPRKIVYDKSLDFLIAITTRMENGDRKNFIRLVDLASGRILTDNQLLWTNTDYGRSDMVLSATEWSVQNKHKTYKYLCVGLGHPKEPFHSFRSGMSARVSKALMDRGTLLLFRLKTNNKFPLKRVWDQEKLPGGVFAICPHSAGLLFSAGSHLYLYRLDPVTGRLVEVAHKALQYLITSIHEEGGRICVTFHNDSVSFYEFDPLLKTYDFLKSDVVSRSIHHSLMLNNRLAVGVSQSGGMVALYDDPNDRSFERRLKCLFNFHYADIIVKPKLATLRTQTHIPSYVLPWDQGATVVRPIVGCTVSGGMIHVFRISEPLYQLLHALSNELVEFEPTKPLLGSTENFGWFCKLSGAEQATIHGDLVELYLRLSPEEQWAVVTDEQGQIKASIQSALNEFMADADSDDAINLLEDILQSFEDFK
ncbi:hypothetical protein MBANPS3_005939 [Mucor bainieri]